MKTKTRQNILDILFEKKQVRAHDLGQMLGISQVAVHKQLKKLLNQEQIVKKGTPPFVVYMLKITDLDKRQIIEDLQVLKVIENNYLYISPEGEIYPGVKGFAEWVYQTEKRTKKKEDINILAAEYVRVRRKANVFFENNIWINATEKLNNTFSQSFVDEVFNHDFYSLPKFGKTKLGAQVLYAKQSQSEQLISDVVDQIKEVIREIIVQKKVDSIAFIPHSIPRKIPFLKYVQKKLDVALPRIELLKAYSGEVLVAQKSLRKIEDRIDNAANTIFVKEMTVPFKRVLLIDDAVGSGATLNETAKKLKQNYGVEKVYGFAIVGSYKGFEVIQEV